MKIKTLTLVTALAIAATACDNNKQPEQPQTPAPQETHMADKYAGATNLIDELDIRRSEPKPLRVEEEKI